MGVQMIKSVRGHDPGEFKRVGGPTYPLRDYNRVVKSVSPLKLFCSYVVTQLSFSFNNVEMYHYPK